MSLKKFLNCINCFSWKYWVPKGTGSTPMIFKLFLIMGNSSLKWSEGRLAVVTKLVCSWNLCLLVPGIIASYLCSLKLLLNCIHILMKSLFLVVWTSFSNANNHIIWGLIIHKYVLFSKKNFKNLSILINSVQLKAQQLNWPISSTIF